jgi:hypothetical protein
MAATATIPLSDILLLGIDHRGRTHRLNSKLARAVRQPAQPGFVNLVARAGGGHILPRSSGVGQHLVREGMPPLPVACVHAQSELTDDASIWINV